MKISIRYHAALLAALILTGCATVPPDGAEPHSQAPDASASERLTSNDSEEPAVWQSNSAEARNDISDRDAVRAEDYADIWERIRAGFAIPGHDNERVRAQLNEYARLTDYWLRVSERAEPYLYHIVEEIDARGMPLELALLPVVESAFRPFAYSHGRAAGLWQFIPATGRHYGLEQNWWYDGRRDVIAATDAALTYLAYLNDMFDGDWLLAIAAYNGGEGTVSRAMQRNAAAGKPTDYWSLDLPRETMAYVPKLLAISELLADPQPHGIELFSIANEPVIEVVELDHQVDLALAAELAGIDIETLYRLNPGYNRWATAPSGPHRLLLPRERVADFNTRLAQTPQESWMRWERHQIAAGETLGEIAARYHITVSDLQAANDLNGHIIRAGGHLLVPVASRPSSSYTLSAAARQDATRSRQREGRSRQNYTVQPGDSFWVIARRYGVGVRELARWNGMAPGDTLAVGAELAIWTDEQTSNSTRLASRTTERATMPGNRLQSVTYTVRSGDSLYRIAQRFNVAIGDLQRWNSIGEGAYLQPGQRLRMQVDVTAQSNY